jgi:bifunctional non-homologous end joining protein LigD
MAAVAAQDNKITTMGRRASTVSITHRDLTAPTTKAKPFNDPAWIWELKHDGYRVLLIKDGERVAMLTRRGNDLLGLFPEIAADLRKLPDIAIDGELVMLDAKGKPEFHLLRGRCAIRDPQRVGTVASASPAAVFAFDLLQLRGKDLRALPLLKRKAALEKELRRTERIVYCKHIGESGERLFEAADQLGLEGVIGKKADSPYRAGRTTNWVKVKTTHGRHIDAEREKWNE